MTRIRVDEERIRRALAKEPGTGGGVDTKAKMTRKTAAQVSAKKPGPGGGVNTRRF